MRRLLTQVITSHPFGDLEQFLILAQSQTGKPLAPPLLLHFNTSLDRFPIPKPPIINIGKELVSFVKFCNQGRIRLPGLGDFGQAVEAIQVLVEAHDGVLAGLACCYQKGPIAGLHQQELPRGLVQDGGLLGQDGGQAERQLLTG